MESMAAHDGRAGSVTRFEPLGPVDLADLLLGLASAGVGAAGRAVDRVRPPTMVTRVVTGLVTQPVTSALGRLGERALRADWSQDVLRSGRWRRRDLDRRALDVARRVAAAVVDAALDLVDVTDVVIDHVDLDAVVRAVDLDRAVERVDVDAVVRRVDIGAVIDRVDVDAVVARADLDRAVARVDLQRIIDRIDVDAVVARADLDAVVAKLDLIELAEYVVEGIDLPGIIRSSTGSMASEGLREVRRQGIGADERVAHVVDRLLHRPERTPGSTYEETTEGSHDHRPTRSGPGDPGLVH